MSRFYYISIFLLILFNGMMQYTCIAQEQIQVNGLVLNEKGLPLPDISVSIEGVLTDPVITDSEGIFSITSPSRYQWLTISPTDIYKQKRVYLNGNENITIMLSPTELATSDDAMLNIFVEEPKRNFISSAQSINPQNFRKVPNVSTDQYFQNNIAGVYSVNRSGMPGSGAVNYIRGIKSMNTNNQPLFVVDGMPLETQGVFSPLLDGYSYNPLSSLDPNDITSITVLKDYSAGSAYGLRGTNGVILIETLKPTEVKTTIDFTLRTGASSSPENIPQLNAIQYKSLANEVLISSGKLEETFPTLYPGLFIKPSDPGYYVYANNTNWQNEIFSNSILNDYYLRIMGGDQIAKYSLSVGYLRHQGIIKNTEYDRFNVRFVGTFSLFKWLRLFVSSNLTRSGSTQEESARIKQTSAILSALHKNPFMIPYDFDAEGNQLKTYADIDELGVSNPSVIINEFFAKNKNYRFLTSVRLEGDISKNLKWNSLVGININSLNESIFLPNHGMERYYRGDVYNAAKALNDYFLALYNDNNITYRKDFNEQHLITATMGFRLNTNDFQEDWGIAKNSNQNDEYRSLQSGTSYMREMGGHSNKWNRLGMYSQLNYTFRDRYLLHAGVMSETSSNIGRNARVEGVNDLIMLGEVPFGLFYSLGGAWRISNESFLQDYAWLEDLKLRLTWGSAGNDDIGSEDNLRYYQIKLYRESSGMVPGNLSDRSLRFETGTQLNPGIDLTLFANRISISFDYFSGKTEHLLSYDPQIFYTGFKSVANNNGSISNKGWEISSFARLITQGRFHWDIGANLSSFKNEILEIRNDEIITDFTGGSFISRKGESIINFYGFQYDGVFSTQQEALDANLKNERGISFGAGDARFLDLSGLDGVPDGYIDNFDKTIIGSPIPDLFGAAFTSITYGIWSLSGTVQFVSGNKIYNYLRSQNEKMSTLSNQSTSVLNRWHYEGHETNVPRASWDDPNGNADFSSRWIEDGSYLRIKDITLSCHIPKKFLLFRDAEFFVTATNLLTFTNYLGYDPEFAVSYNTMEQGIDYGQMPITKNFMIGIKVGL